MAGNGEKRKRKALKTIGGLITGKNKKASVSQLSDHTLQALANAGDPAASRQAKLEIRKRATKGQEGPGPMARKRKKKRSLNDMVGEVLKA